MEYGLLIKIAILVICLIALGIALTAYEFREHIIEHIKKRRSRRQSR